jgi:hypothetical protein
MVTMEKTIAMEANEIIRISDKFIRDKDIAQSLEDIKLRAQNILKTLEEGDPE